MLKALYDYAVQNGLTQPPGFVSKPIRAYILLSDAGEYLGIEKCENETQSCPDIGSLANSPDKCNPLAEKAEILLCAPPQTPPAGGLSEKDAVKAKKAQNNLVKKQFFQTLLRDGAQQEPVLALCLRTLEDPALFAVLQEEAGRIKLKGMDRISFKVDGIPVMKAPGIRPWWSEYRRRFAKTDGKGTSLCLITGEPTVPMATVPAVSGLQVVGGHARGDALICFDKSAFCSYGLKQSANAPVSEEAFAAVKAALDDLLASNKAPILAGMKFVHWYDKPLPPKEDPICLFTSGWDDGEEEDEADDEADAQTRQYFLKKERAAAGLKADSLIKSAESGAQMLPLADQYYILLLSGANGRVMVRRYAHGSYAELQRHLDQWYSDLELYNAAGTGPLRPCKLTARLIALLSRQKADIKPFDRLQKELAGLTPAILMAILNGTPLPDAVAERALATIRSKMVDPNEKDKTPYIPDGICCQWLKVWLLRRPQATHKEVPLMPYYDPNFPNAAYHCGALVAIYADIQRAAMPDVNAGIVQRYYASASRTPTLVLGQLERLSKYHMDKVRKDSPGFAWKYEQLLNEAYTYFGSDGVRRLPSVLNLEEQSYFALGYRQMCARMNADRSQSKANKAAQAAEQEEA